VRTFIILWLGQFVSSIGSSMTYFALTLWVWQQTKSATAIALILVFYQLPQIVISLISGILVDRLPHRCLLMISDAAAACCTISIGILAAFQILQLWHIYLVAAVIGCFGNLQSLTYSTLIPLIVPQQHHARASSLGTMIGYGAGILSPALAGLLYPVIGLLGITLMDMTTFAIALLSLLAVALPQATPQPSQSDNVRSTPHWKRHSTVKAFWQDSTSGFRYIAAQPSLRAMVIVLSLFAFFHQASEVLYQPMILAKTGGNTQLLGAVVAASGVGGVVGAVVLGIWGGFRSRILGIIWGLIGTGLSWLSLGLGRGRGVWAIARFSTSLHSPLIFSSYMAIWYAQVPQTLQGRVFAADYVIGTVIEATAGLGAGLLADRVFEPAMQARGWPSTPLGAIAGTGPGSGLALVCVLSAVGILLVGLSSFKIAAFRDAEIWTPDGDET
jgi:DHA3 family macrolide efflux protein-like MFS transporter